MGGRLFPYQGARDMVRRCHNNERLLVHMLLSVEAFMNDLRNEPKQRWMAAAITIEIRWHLEKLKREQMVVLFPIPRELRDAA